MSLDISRYVAPKHLRQLWKIVAKAEQPPLFYAGDDLLLLQAKRRSLGSEPPRTWVDLTRLSELKGIKETSEGIWIGASTTYNEIAEHPLVMDHARALQMSAQQVGAWQVRNRNTIGGYASRGAKEADLLPALYVLGATIICHNGTTERRLSCEEFYKDTKAIALQENEIITGFFIPIRGRQSVYLKLTTSAPRCPAKVSIAVSLNIHNENYSQIRFALGAVGPKILRATSAEGLLEGQPIADTTLLSRVADEVRRAALPASDQLSSARYRKWGIGILAVQALQQIADEHKHLTESPKNGTTPTGAP